MGHLVKDIRELHSEAKRVYENGVHGSGDKVISDLGEAIENLKEHWKGSDANKQINDLIDVHNAMVELRNILARLSVDTAASAIAYDNTIASHGGTYYGLGALAYDEKNKKDNFQGQEGGLDIDGAAITGKQKIEAAISEFNELKDIVHNGTSSILDNWQKGDEIRQRAEEAFENFKQHENEYEETLNTIKHNIEVSLQDYNVN